MKKAYLIIVIFGFWCLSCALWYMFAVKGTSDPSDTALAIVEIMIMTLISVLLGFAIAWYMREDYLNLKQNDIQELLMERSNILSERNSILNELHVQRVRANKAEQTLARARQTFHDDFIKVSRERDRMKEERSAVQNILSELKDEYTLLQIQLSNEQEKVADLTYSLKTEQQQAAQKEKENAGVRYFINPFSIAATIEKDDIDDLKKIKGIGPVIEKKLNMLGIVSFKQISELNEEALDQVAHTLKFFPDRIKRDNWVQQARELSRIKIK
jgi:predicted flap endonuclease-1-like 5' DNA nuclease